jgi:hypothetical protein
VCKTKSSLRLRVVRNLRRDKSFEAIEGSTKSWSISSDSRRRRFGSQLIKSKKDSLVHFVNVSRRRRQTVRILGRGFAKPRQPSDLLEKRGGYGYVWRPSSKDHESLDQPIDSGPLKISRPGGVEECARRGNREPSDLTQISISHWI